MFCKNSKKRPLTRYSETGILLEFLHQTENRGLWRNDTSTGALVGEEF